MVFFLLGIFVHQLWERLPSVKELTLWPPSDLPTVSFYANFSVTSPALLLKPRPVESVQGFPIALRSTKINNFYSIWFVQTVWWNITTLSLDLVMFPDWSVCCTWLKSQHNLYICGLGVRLVEGGMWLRTNKAALVWIVLKGCSFVSLLWGSLEITFSFSPSFNWVFSPYSSPTQQCLAQSFLLCE